MTERRPGHTMVSSNRFYSEPLDSLRAFALYQRSIICASDVYWDGALLTQNGRVADTRRNEVREIIAIHDHSAASLSSGKHIIAIRVSNFHTYSGLMEEPLLIGYFRTSWNAGIVPNAAFAMRGYFPVSALFHFAIMFGRAAGPPTRCRRSVLVKRLYLLSIRRCITFLSASTGTTPSLLSMIFPVLHDHAVADIFLV